jgi:GntR family transcriptional regulator
MLSSMKPGTNNTAATRIARRTPGHPAADAKVELRLASSRGTSLHRKVFLVIRDRILSGLFPSGETLPSEEELSRMFAVSRVTIRVALANLEAAQLVERRHGVGTFVNERVEGPQIHAPISDLLAHIADVGRATQVKLLELALVKAPLVVQSLFECAADQVFQRAVRLRSMHKIPIFYVVTYVPEYIARRFTRKQMSGPSLYQLLRSEGFNFKAGKQVVSAVLADPAVAEALKVDVGAPLLQIRRIHFDGRMKPFEYMDMLASPDRFELHMMLGADDMPG